jgi:F-type H+-transporting ATPase subunit epsilon
VTLRVALVAPDGEIWSGRARMVIAKTLEGDLGVLTGHAPVLGILAEASLVRILDPEGEGTSGTEDGQGAAGGGEVVAAVSSGFFAVADDRVSVLVGDAQLGSRVDTAAAQATIAAAGQPPPGEPEPLEVRYSRALLRAAGERS